MASNQNQQSDMWSDIELHSLYDVSHSTDFTWCSKKSLFKRSRVLFFIREINIECNDDTQSIYC